MKQPVVGFQNVQSGKWLAIRGGQATTGGGGDHCDFIVAEIGQLGRGGGTLDTMELNSLSISEAMPRQRARAGGCGASLPEVRK